jgi:hypothetical protein
VCDKNFSQVLKLLNYKFTVPDSYAVFSYRYVSSSLERTRTPEVRIAGAVAGSPLLQVEESTVSSHGFVRYCHQIALT